MEKTSREYAEKLAREKYISEHSINVSIESYLKAVEETNVKELREALDNLIKDIKADGYNYRLASMNMAIKALENEK